MVDSVAVEELTDDDSSSSTLKVREKNNSKSTKIKTKSDYFGSLLRGGGKKTKIKTTAHTMEEEERYPVSSACFTSQFVYNICLQLGLFSCSFPKNQIKPAIVIIDFGTDNTRLKKVRQLVIIMRVS